MPMIKLTNETDAPQTVTEDSERKATVTIAPGETVDVAVSAAELSRLLAAGVKVAGDPASKPTAAAPAAPAAKPAAAKADDDDDEPKRRR